MTTGTITFSIKPVRDKNDNVSLSEIHHETQENESELWKQINEIVENTISYSLPQSEFHELEERGTEGKILLAPGIAVSSSEYEKRYGSIEIERYKKQMSPELFKVFIRHIGAIHGTRKLNIDELTSNIEE